MKKTLTTLTLITAIIASIFAGTLTTSAAEAKTAKVTITLKVSTNFEDDFYAEDALNLVNFYWNGIKDASKYYLQMRKSTEKKYTTLFSRENYKTDQQGAWTEAPTEAGKYYYRIVAKVNGKNIASNRVQITVPKKTAAITETAPKTTQEEELITAETSTKTIDTEAMAKEVFDLVNVERAKAGLSQVVWDEDLAYCAMIRAKETVTNYSHTRLDGSAWYTVLSERSISIYGVGGENIYRSPETAEQAMDGWMKSAGHKANILKQGITRMAVASYEYDDCLYWVQLFND